MSNQSEFPAHQKDAPIQQENTQKKRKKPGPFLDFLFALLIFIAVILLTANLIAPNLYRWGFDYTSVKYAAVPVLTAVTLFFGYRAQSKLRVLLSVLFHRLKK